VNNADQCSQALPQGHRNGRDAQEHRPQLSERLALRPKEAAEALGISERTLRQLLPELPTVRRGNIVLVPVAGLQEWLREESEAESGRVEKAVGEILEAIHPPGKD
jgi:excisionase family DNA binding protein